MYLNVNATTLKRFRTGKLASIFLAFGIFQFQAAWIDGHTVLLRTKIRAPKRWE